MDAPHDAAEHVRSLHMPEMVYATTATMYVVAIGMVVIAVASKTRTSIATRHTPITEGMKLVACVSIATSSRSLTTVHQCSTLAVRRLGREMAPVMTRTTSLDATGMAVIAVKAHVSTQHRTHVVTSGSPVWIRMEQTLTLLAKLDL